MASSERTDAAPATSAAQGTAVPAAPTDQGQPATPSERSGTQGRDDSSGPTAAATPIERARISCEMNARYHACREAHLDTVHRWIMFGIIAFGAAAILDVLPSWVRGVLSAAAALLGALDLTFDLSNRARMHALMKRRYFELLADVIEGKKDLEAMQAIVNRYNADEEPAYHALLSSCWNAAQEMVYGEDAMALKIPRHHHMLKNLFRFGSHRYST